MHPQARPGVGISGGAQGTARTALVLEHNWPMRWGSGDFGPSRNPGHQRKEEGQVSSSVHRAEPRVTHAVGKSLPRLLGRRPPRRPVAIYGGHSSPPPTAPQPVSVSFPRWQAWGWVGPRLL